MSKFVDIQVSGGAELQAKLRKLDLALQKKIVRKALRKAWRPVLAATIAKVPVDTGALRAGIKLRALKARKGNFGVQVMLPRRDELDIDNSSPWYYPAILEYGHENAAPRPFLRPAFDENRDRALNIFADEVSKGITAAAHK